MYLKLILCLILNNEGIFTHNTISTFPEEF